MSSVLKKADKLNLSLSCIYSLKHTFELLKCTDNVDRASVHAFLCFIVDKYDVELLVNSNVFIYSKEFNFYFFLS